MTSTPEPQPSSPFRFVSRAGTAERIKAWKDRYKIHERPSPSNSGETTPTNTTDSNPFRFLTRNATADRIRAWRDRHRQPKQEDRRDSLDEEGEQEESPEGMFVSASDTPYPEPMFEEIEVKLLKTTPYLKQKWYDWDNIRHGSFRRQHGTHEKDVHDIEFRHKPTGTHWTLSMRPKDFHKLSALLCDPQSKNPVLMNIQRKIRRRCALSPIHLEQLKDPGSQTVSEEVEMSAKADDGRFSTPTQMKPLPKCLPKTEKGGEQLVEYLRDILKTIKEPWNILGETWCAIEERRKGMILCGFIELSRTSLIGTWEDGVKGKEGWARKRRGGRKNDVFCFPDFLVPRMKQRRWFALRSNYLLYFLSPMDLTPQEVMLIDGYFQVLHKDIQRKEVDLRPPDEDPTGNEEDRVAVRPGGRQHHVIRNALLLRPFNKRTNEVWVKDKSHLAVLNGFRDLLVDFHNEIGGRGKARVAREWAMQLEFRRQMTPWFRDVQVDRGRYDSFAPVRRGVDPEGVRWVVDGSSHFEQIYEAIMNAEKEILIADWFITPEIFLKRGADGIHPEHLPTRLDRLLFKKANEGVRIYILVYKEMNLPNASLHAKEEFMARRNPYYLLDQSVEDPNGELVLKEKKNIVVLRHPDQGRGFIGPVLDTVMWAHHEKAAVVDRKIAFIGGIDLCVGRYDTAEHTLRDDVVYNATGEVEGHGTVCGHFSQTKATLEGRDTHEHGMIECSPVLHKILGIFEGDDDQEGAAKAAEQPQADGPINGKDIEGIHHPSSAGENGTPPGVHLKGDMSVAQDHVSPTSLMMPTEGSMTSLQDENADAPKRGLDRLTSKPIANIFPGQDFSNPRIKDFANLGDSPFGDIIARDHTARMPWHDIACTFRKRPGEENIEGPVDDLVWHFIQRWNFAKWEKKKRDQVIPWLYPSQGLKKPTEAEQANGSIEMQVLRSAAQWSAGSPREKSIQNAYLDLIRKSEHFVYIENQFFITKYSPFCPHQPSYYCGCIPKHRNRRGQLLPKSRVRVHNAIAAVLVERILRAHANGQVYRAYIVIPLFPAFHGDVTKRDADPALPYVLSAQTECIRGFLDELQKGGIAKEDVHKYVCFVGLRKWDVLGKRLVTEQIYVHAKIMIADDRHVIIGSANINDRSMMGSRDSELAFVIKDEKPITVRMNNQQFPHASKFAHTLRLRLFHEHLGIPFPHDLRDVHDPQMDPTSKDFASEPHLLDPVSNECWSLWMDRLDINTKVLRYVFHCIPDDTVKTWKDYKEFLKTRGGEHEEKIEQHMHELAKEQGVPLTLSLPDVDRTRISEHTTESDEIQTKEEEKLAIEILEENVKGHAVRFPVHFLEEEDLSSLFRGLHKLAPRQVFT